MIDVKVGYDLSKERWNEAAENMEAVAPLIAKWLEKQNFEGRGKEDASEFMADAQLAIVALKYVAEFAADKCRFVPIGNQPNSDAQGGSER